MQPSDVNINSQPYMMCKKGLSVFNYEMNFNRICKILDNHVDILMIVHIQILMPEVLL